MVKYAHFCLRNLMADSFLLVNGQQICLTVHLVNVLLILVELLLHSCH